MALPLIMDFKESPLIYKDQLIYPRTDLCSRIDMVPQSTKPYFFHPDLAPISAEQYFCNHFLDKIPTYTVSGTEAIHLALKQLALKSDDVVTIFTTTQNFYVSSCITKTIEKYCNWSREIKKKTKVIYVNHEFGFPYEPLKALQAHGMPIIEDCAYSFSANNQEQSVGHVGDLIIFSLPKFFPMQIGGVLLSTKAINNPTDPTLQLYIKKQLEQYLPQTALYSSKRRELYALYLKYFSSLTDFIPRFNLKSHDVPGAFLFHTPSFIDLPQIKRYYARHGVESSVFYGEEVYFLPLHQNLVEQDIQWLYTLTDYFYKKIANMTQA